MNACLWIARPYSKTQLHDLDDLKMRLSGAPTSIEMGDSW